MTKLLKQRHELYFNQKVDWALAEQLLAHYYLKTILIGCLVKTHNGHISHRHSVIKDVATENNYIPLNHIDQKQAIFSI